MSFERSRFLWLIVIAVWVGCHLWFCGKAFFLEPPGNLHFVFLVLLNFVVLACSVTRKRGAWDQGHDRALLAGFILSIIPLGLTILAFVTSSPVLPHFLDGTGTSIDLSTLSGTPSGRQAFLVAVDVSKSVLTSQPENKIDDEICSSMKLILDHGAAPPRVVPLDATFWAFQFAKEYQFLDARTNSFVDPNVSEMARSFCQALREARKSNKENQQLTDFTGFLEEMLPRVEQEVEKFDHISIVIFSDFIQQTERSTMEEKARLQDVMTRLREIDRAAARRKAASVNAGSSANPVLSVIGITVPRETGGKKHVFNNDELDLLPLLNSDLPRHWAELSLEAVLTVRPENETRILLNSLMSAEVQLPVDNALFLQYPMGGWSAERAVTSSIQLPLGDREFELTALRLRTKPDRGSLPQRVSVEFGSEDYLFTSGGTLLHCDDQETEWRPYTIKGVVAGKLGFRLASHVDVSRSQQLELLLAVPEKGIVYVIPVVVAPAAQTSAKVAYKTLVMFFAACVLLFAWTEFRSPHRTDQSLRQTGFGMAQENE